MTGTTKIAARHNRVAFGLAIAFAALYAAFGLLLAGTPAFLEYDLLFEIDTPRSVEDFAVFRGSHDRTSVHPIFVLLVNPVGSLLSLLVGSPETAAVLLNALLGGAAVGLAFLLFRRLAADRLGGLLAALLFGFSASQLVCGSVPSAATLATCALLATHIVFLDALDGGRVRRLRWLAVGVLSMGGTTTNLAQPLITRGLLALRETRFRPSWGVARLLLVYGASVVALTAALATLQKLIYPSSRVFFTLRAFVRELPFVDLWILREPGAVLPRVLEQFVWVNVVAPLPAISPIEGKVIPAVTFAASREFLAVGWVATALWAAWLAAGLLSIRKLDAARVTFVGGVLLCLGFNLALHSVYGIGEKGKIELLLYSGNFTFLSIAVGAVMLCRGGWAPRLWAAALVATAAANNLRVLATILGVYLGGGA